MGQMLPGRCLGVEVLLLVCILVLDSPFGSPVVDFAVPVSELL